MEVMEDGNLMDKVNILIQRDMEYYKAKQSVLQETICPGIIGGKLDFPRSASFAAVKLAVWWEEEYVAAYRKPSGLFQRVAKGNRDSSDTSGACGGIVRSSDPSKFISNLSKSADQLLEHLHVLTQEALDHADLTVLTGTIGAAALLKNFLWFYTQIPKDTKSPSMEPLQTGYKKYNDMCEALAERLLDLHCRLLSLYILQDADCLDWENEKPFFESERGSYIIQMWWLYMQGTKEDLWTTVPPKMAQRVFSGMLNESLTILTVRYTQSLPTEARTDLLLVDVSNLLFCVAQLLPSICDSANDLTGNLHTIKSKILRDVHVKCQELYSCLLLRGATLDTLHKVFKKDTDNALLFHQKPEGPAAWITFALPHFFKNFVQDQTCNPEWLGLELMVLLAQPQANWALLLKVLCSNLQKILRLLLNEFMERTDLELKKTVNKTADCGNFLCPGDGSCRNVEAKTATLTSFHYYELIAAVSQILLHVGNEEELKNVFVVAITSRPGWAKCFERRHVWNQIRSPWYEAVINLVAPILPVVEETVTNALQTGATMYQAMSLIVACFNQYWDMLDSSLIRIANIFQEIIPCNVTPVSNSVLMQILVSALYSSLVAKSENLMDQKEVKFQDQIEQKPENLEELPRRTSTVSTNRGSIVSTGSAALAAAEALCSIDEDNKHTDQIEEFLKHCSDYQNDTSIFVNAGSKNIEQSQQMLEIIVSDLLMTAQGKRSLKIIWHFIKCNSEWLYNKLGVSEKPVSDQPNKVLQSSEPLLHKMFHIGYRPFDQLLTKELKPNWHNLLQTPLGLTAEKVWMQVSYRWDFQQSASPKLSAHDIDIVNNLTFILKQ